MASIGSSIVPVVKASEFHAMYRSCFENTCQPIYNSDYPIVRSAIHNLLLPDLEARDKKILENIEKIQKIALQIPKPVIITQLENTSELTTSGKAFWQMLFADSEQNSQLQSIILQSIKALQDDFKKYQIIDETSLRQCFENEQFFKKIVNQPDLKIINGYRGFEREKDKTRKSSEKSNLNDVKTPWYFIYPNIYSEEELNELSAKYPAIVNTLKKTRNYFIQEAKNNLIQIAIQIEISLTDGKAIYRAIEELYRYSDAGNVAKPHVITMNALVYDEIMNKRIHTKEEAEQFVVKQFLDKTSPLYNIENYEIDKETAIRECKESLEAFEEIWNKKSN